LTPQPITCSTAFALAAILRFLTPAEPVPAKNGVYRGWLDKVERNTIANGGTINDSEATTVYADGLSYNLEKGWYEFRCTCDMVVPSIISGERPLPDLLGSFATSQQPFSYENVVRAYLMKKDGGDLSELASDPCTKAAFTKLVKSVSCLYAKMVVGDGLLEILSKLPLEDSCDTLIDGSFDTDSDDDYRPLHFKASTIDSESFLLKVQLGKNRDAIRSVVFSEVASALAIDLHTHLLPPAHGALCLFGIDEMLTYHYLVAEYFMTAPVSVIPEEFYALTKQKQADIIWKALFVERTPISEACRGVLTTLVALGLEQEVQSRNLNAMRKFFSNFRDEGVAGAEKYSSLVFQKSGIRYAVMTNIPFDPTETQHWKPKPKVSRA